MKLAFAFFSFALSSCPEKWTEDASSGACIPAGAFEFACNADGTASLTLELNHFYTNLPEDVSALTAGLISDGWVEEFNSALGVNEGMKE